VGFNEANKKVHPVETQWHYKIAIKYGYVALTKEQEGFVRTYHYRHPETGHEFFASTGSSADYFNSKDSQGKENGFGYWGELEKFLDKTREKK